MPQKEIKTKIVVCYNDATQIKSLKETVVEEEGIVLEPYKDNAFLMYV